MGPFLVQAGLEGRIGASLTSAGISVSEYRRARADDPAFDSACVDLEILRRAQIVSNVEDLAASGNLQAVRLVAKGLGELRVHASGADPEMPPHVQAAMLEAGLAAFEGREPWGPPPDDPFEWYHAASPSPGYHRPDHPCPRCGRPPDLPGEPPRRYVTAVDHATLSDLSEPRK
jgi:hypothetical protein